MHMQFLSPRVFLLNVYLDNNTVIEESKRATGTNRIFLVNGDITLSVPY